ncbi:MAG: hypothetical protein PHD72_03395 [Patescibacteria group bacterium]|nr:hypothetical protein [Patescibacteria group bacterium]
MFWAAIISLIILYSFVSWIVELSSNSKKYLELKPKLDNLGRLEREQELKIASDNARLEDESRKKMNEFSQKIKQAKDALDLEARQWNEKVLKDKEEIQINREEVQLIANQKSMGFPWLADAYADYFSLLDFQRESYLAKKNHPAFSAAEIVRVIKEEKKELLRSNKIISYQINYYEKLFPWLTELIAENENEDIPVCIESADIDEKNNEDRARQFLTAEEYKKLPSVVRNQKALDRYLSNRNKSKWAIGRDYEMYVGYSFEQKGYAVEYKGIIDGFEDLGRDVIAKKNGEVCIVQCKYWAQYKEIHEKHVFQLFGTTMEYWIKNFENNTKPKTFKEFAKFLNENKLRPIFFTSTVLSNKAKEMADVLSIEIKENEPVGEFPRIKCNISGRDGEKIYHLPFDQQYDRTIIEKHKGEFCAFTVKEAEDAGFRRAFRHRY